MRIFHYLWSLLSDSLDQIKYSFLTTLMRMIQFWGDLGMDFFRFFCEYHFSSLLATFIPYNFPLSIQIIAKTYMKSGTCNSNHLLWFILVDVMQHTPTNSGGWLLLFYFLSSRCLLQLENEAANTNLSITYFQPKKR